jgi:hypothetical protein
VRLGVTPALALEAGALQYGALIKKEASKNSLFEPFIYVTEHFTKTGSGQTYGKLKKRAVFSQDVQRLAVEHLRRGTTCSASDVFRLHDMMRRLAMTLCTAERPRCAQCPLAHLCATGSTLVTKAPVPRPLADEVAGLMGDHRAAVAMFSFTSSVWSSVSLPRTHTTHEPQLIVLGLNMHFCNLCFDAACHRHQCRALWARGH